MPLQIEKRSSYILVHGSGLATLAEAQQHFRELSAFLVAERRTVQGVRLMIDLRRAEAHPTEVAGHIEKVLPILYRKNDRVAVVVRDTARKNHTRNSHDRVYSDVFLTQEAAEAYLA